MSESIARSTKESGTSRSSSVPTAPGPMWKAMRSRAQPAWPHSPCSRPARSPTHRRFTTALEFLRRFAPDDLRSTYAIGLQTMVYAAAEPERDRLRIVANVTWLKRPRSDPEIPSDGPARGVTPRQEAAGTATAPTPNMPCWACMPPARPAYWSRRKSGSCAGLLDACQRDDGSWAYTPDSPADCQHDLCRDLQPDH